ncbi:MAG: metallophosphoesterase [Pseudomonadota bacterium]
MWLLGDSGTATEVGRDGKPSHPGEAEAVKQGFLKYVQMEGKNEAADLLLLLGDNAYPAGTDNEWQGAYFDIYPALIKTTPTVPTIGNHEMGVAPLNICIFVKAPGCDKGPVMYPLGGVSDSSDPMSYDGNGDGPDPSGMPYLQIFTLPAKAEQGGVPSGTEQYYSMDYGTVHIVSLDSQLSSRDPQQLQTMRDWLVDDLSANKLDWTVVIFHHPPYSKGKNHDSDLEQREIDMRQAFAPVFEKYGVDVIYSGHAHSYERSWYLGGHYGFSNTFDPKQHTETDNEGNPTLGQEKDPYPQISAKSGQDDKAVYTVAGSSGKIGGKEPPCEGGNHMGCTMPDWLEHPAHRTFEKLADDYQKHGIERLGSVVLDAGADQLISRFIDDKGNVLDYFIIKR